METRANPPRYPRSWVLTVTCPACRAEPGAHCQGVAGPRVSNHLERVWRYHDWAREQGEPHR